MKPVTTLTLTYVRGNKTIGAITARIEEEEINNGVVSLVVVNEDGTKSRITLEDFGEEN
ncbi:hypothetical protein ACFWY9_28750 [Amycolatopsis sp. NPDC059027]|uniref:hypothetical protein n=1 Tax=Amycolatopsis sp. NPDC059027 TaxID=3346709 RepID=UPI00366E844A